MLPQRLRIAKRAAQHYSYKLTSHSASVCLMLVFACLLLLLLLLFLFRRTPCHTLYVRVREEAILAPAPGTHAAQNVASLVMRRQRRLCVKGRPWWVLEKAVHAHALGAQAAQPFALVFLVQLGLPLLVPHGMAGAFKTRLFAYGR